MRVVFMGTPEFAVPSLDALLGAHDVVAVYTRPDSMSGRGRKVIPSPVKLRALEAGVPLLQPATLRDAAVQEALAALEPDAIVVAAFGLILPPEVLAIPRFGCVNVHASLLPRWRGAAPIQRAILAGDERTGVAIMRMEAGLDTGPTCLMRETEVDEKSADALTTELAMIGAEALVESLDLISSGRVVWSVQSDDGATYADKLRAVDVALAPELTVDLALRRVRASGASAPCRLAIAGKRVVVLEASRATEALPAGSASLSGGLLIGLADGAVRIERVVPEGRSAMTGDAFARGARLGDSPAWSAS